MIRIILCSEVLASISEAMEDRMKAGGWRIAFLLCVLLLIVVAVLVLRNPDRRSLKLHSPELEYLKAVNSVAPPKDPELMFILMGEFANSNLQDEGAEFFS